MLITDATDPCLGGQFWKESAGLSLPGLGGGVPVHPSTPPPALCLSASWKQLAGKTAPELPVLSSDVVFHFEMLGSVCF